MTEDAFPILLAAFFTCGCITIHEAREHAKAMTPPLLLTAVCLWVFIFLLILAEPPTVRGDATTVSHAGRSPSSPMMSARGRQVPP